MQKKISILILIAILTPIMGGAQAFNNEFWVYIKKNLASHTFIEYYFKDGKYILQKRYSGGQYYVTKTEGKYTYNSVKNTIHLTTDAGEKETLNLSNITDSTITITEIPSNKVSPNIMQLTSLKDTDTINVYKRRIGIVDEQRWNFSNGTQSFYFDYIGQFRYTIKDKLYIGNYSFIDNVLYLEVKEKTLQRKLIVNLPISDNERKVCLRVNYNKQEINQSDLLGLTNNKFYNWELKNGKFHHDKFDKENIWEKFEIFEYNKLWK